MNRSHRGFLFAAWMAAGATACGQLIGIDDLEFGGTGGAATLSSTFSAGGTGGAGAGGATGGGTTGTGESCADPIVVSPDDLPFRASPPLDSYRDDLSLGAEDCPDNDSTLGENTPDIVYQFTPNVSGPHTFSVSGLSGSIALLLGCPPTPKCARAELADPLSTLAFVEPLDAGDTYFVVVDGDVDPALAKLRFEIVGPYDSANPLQIGPPSVLTDDTVANSGAGMRDPADDPVDVLGFTLLTQELAEDLSEDTPDGLPDDAFFPPTKDHPPVSLHWRADDDGPNSRIIRLGGDTIIVPLPRVRYAGLQLFGMGTGGSQDITITVRYANGPSDESQVTFQDWGMNPLNGFLLASGLDRVAQDFFDDVDTYSITGVDVMIDETRYATDIEITKEDSGGAFVLYGLTGF